MALYKMHAAGCRIVTRFKRSTPLACSEERPVAEGGHILSDRVGKLPARQAASRKNPFFAEVREVCVRMETSKILRILSTTSKPAPKRSPTSTNAAGASSCSSAGSSRH
ncbi:MAG: hypothetical protein U0S49_15565 [Rhodospirillales bacterium]|nr:hypothetical protein [Rhodospirillales bacterium]